MSKYYYPEDRIAVVGLGCIFADAEDIQGFWRNILSKKVSIKELPNEVVNAKIHYRPEAYKQIRKDDKTYTIMGSLINTEPILSAAKKFRIPPAVAEYMDFNQHAAIYCVDQALQSMQGKQPDKERTAVILSTGTPVVYQEKAVERVFYAEIKEYLRNNPLLMKKLDPSELDGLIQTLSAQALKNNLPLSEDSAPGFLPNLVPGRIANVFDFHGPSFTVDAACASSLAALIVGVQGLLRREYDAVISGATDIGLNAIRLTMFSAINALSPNGSFPFDTRANGFVMGQGGGILILKRLEDALQDHDNIIALISGYGEGSDGKGKYIAAPSEEGQIRVVQQACQMAGYPVDTIELMEAHGTGTTVGDVVEVGALKKAFSALGASQTNNCGLGSVKSNIGHLKAAAGVPGVIKATLALHHKVLPPTANVQQINPKLQLEGSPFYVLTERKEWLPQSDHPRRANVSAFGFGGADYHITLEEFRPEFYRKVHSVPDSTPANQAGDLGVSMKNQTEVLLFSGESQEDLTSQYWGFQEEAGLQSFSRRVFHHNAKVSARQKVRLAICASSDEDLAQKWRIFEDSMRSAQNDQTEGLALHGVYYHDGPAVHSEQVAMLFPGQASQYPNMEKELVQAFPVVQSIYAQADAWWQAHYGYSITSLIFGEDEAALEQGLKETKNTHPAMFLSCAGLYKLFSESGVKADYLIGHSLGEMTALYAGEMLDLPAALALIGARGFSFDAIPKDRRGKMMSIKADRASVTVLLEKLGYDIRIANLNSHEQTVVGGVGPEIDLFDKVLTEQKIIHTVLNVSHAFHTPLVAEAAESFFSKIAGLPFSVPRAKICLNHLQEFYPDSAKALKGIPQILKDQIVSSVRFADSIEMLYAKGVRVFLEVGPSTVLSNLVRKVLEGKAVTVIAANQKRKDAVESYHQALAQLFALGIEVRMVPSQASLSDGPTLRGDIAVNCQPKEIDSMALPELENLVYSGVSMGLPGSFKKLFDDDNFNL
ncbi:MAG TPA: beta-ketoacyl synthase N-terminal-like domain-containing protein, partial [Bacillota bacterium]|nr:beta-ketoacyl synthase N-terminal-like domain-containing protein [Bacillota bacterium]